MSSLAAVWHDTLRAIAAACRDPVILVGSTPPGASDLDVLVRDTDRAAAEQALRACGAVGVGSRWRVPGNDPLGVDLLTPSSWNLPAGAPGALWERACDLADHSGVVAPDPAHELLLAARRLAWNGDLGPRSLQRARDARASGEAGAVRLAPGWHAAVALQALLRLLEHGQRPTTTDRTRAVAAELRGRGVAPLRAAVRAVRHVMPGPRRGALVAVSGVDGSGKSTVTHALIDALDAAGLRPVRRWMRFSHTQVAHLAAVGVKRLLGRDEVHTASHQGPAAAADDVRARAAGARDNRPPLTTLAWAWMLTIVFIGRAARLELDRWRGRTVICDRYVLDALAELQGRYGLPGGHPAMRVLRALTATPSVALYIDVEPEVAVARQDDDQWPPELLASSVAAYRHLAPTLLPRVVDGTADREAVIDEAVAATFGALHELSR